MAGGLAEDASRAKRLPASDIVGGKHKQLWAAALSSP